MEEERLDRCHSFVSMGRQRPKMGQSSRPYATLDIDQYSTMNHPLKKIETKL